MALEITDYCNVLKRAHDLKLNIPNGLSFLPRNFESAKSDKELLHESTIKTIRSLFRQNKIDETKLEYNGQDIPFIQENSFSLILPILFVSGLIFTQHPDLLSIALNIMGNYATDFFKGIPGKNEILLNVIVENNTKKIYKKINYRGNPEGLKEIAKIARKVFEGDE